MNIRHSNLLLKVAAIFGVIGAGMGGHMAGSYDYSFRPVHAHVLVVGWLSLFSWAVYYRVFKPTSKKLATLHVYTAIVGTIGLTSGMALDLFDVVSEALYMIVYIGGGVTLLISFILFGILAFLNNEG